MSSASKIWQRLGGAPDPRSEREVQDDIDAEFAFHLEQREREFAAQGMSAAEAHEAALRQFGNIDKVRAECRRVQLGGRVMLQRVTLVLLVALLGVMAWLSFQSIASQRTSKAEIAALHAEISQLMQAVQRDPSGFPLQVDVNRSFVGPTIFGAQGRWGAPQPAVVLDEEATSVQTWLARFQEDASKGIHTEERALSLRRQCSANRGLEVLEAIWLGLGEDQRLVLLNVLVDSHAERLARGVVHLGAIDEEPRLVRRALELLRELTFVRFSVEQRAEYLAWYAANKDIALNEIVEKTAPALVSELSDLGSWNEICALYTALHLQLDRSGAAGCPELLREAGAVTLIQAWTRDPSPKARVAAVNWMSACELDEVTIRMLLLPMLSNAGPRDPAFLGAVCEMLQARQCSWSWEALLSELKRVMLTTPLDRNQLEPIALALGEQETKQVLPTVLAWLIHANSPIVDEVLGTHALPTMTDVGFEPAHDAAWWRNWWSIHRSEYPKASNSTFEGLPRVAWQ